MRNLPEEPLAPAFEHYQRVIVRGATPRSAAYAGARGTVVWLESQFARQEPSQPARWLYLIHLADGGWVSFYQSDLDPAGGFDHKYHQFGDRYEVSFDMVIDDDIDWMEGSYRLPGQF